MLTWVRFKVRRARTVIGKARLYSNWFPRSTAFRYALLDRRGRSGTINIAYPGYPEPFRARLGSTDIVTFGHVIGDNCYSLPFDPGTPSWIIDAGANTGYSAVYFAQQYPSATVVAMEPDKGNFELLLYHADRYPNIVPVMAALWDVVGTVRLTDPGRGDWGFQVDDAASVGVEVPALTVEAIMEQFQIDKVDVLKVDIEGGERAVFTNSRSWIDHVDQIAIELHDRFVPGCTGAFDAATTDFVRRSARAEDVFVAR